MAGSGLFGQFLLERGQINRDQLLAATRLVESRNERFGDLAIALGMLSAKIRDQVIRRQNQEGKKFGEVALEMGVMKPEEISRVLATQQERNVAISDALVELGVISREVVDQEFAAYNSLGPKTSVLDLRHIDCQEHREFVRWTIRLLDQIAHLPAQLCDCKTDEDPFHVVMQAHAFGWCEFHMLANQPLVSRITAAWTGGWIETPELLADVFREFLNTVVGKTFSTSPVGRRITMEPPYSFFPKASPDAAAASTTPGLLPPGGLQVQTLLTPLGCLIAGFSRGRTKAVRKAPGEADLAAPELPPKGQIAVVADASGAVRRMIRDMLVELGCQEVVEAGSSSQAVELAGRLKPALLVCDLGLPDRPGLESLKESLAASPQTHVVVMVSPEHQAEVAELLRSGASGYLTKPVTMPHLQEALAKLYLV